MGYSRRRGHQSKSYLYISKSENQALLEKSRPDSWPGRPAQMIAVTRNKDKYTSVELMVY